MMRARQLMRSFTFLLVLGALAVLGCATAQRTALPPATQSAGEAFRPFFFILAADPQFGMIADNRNFTVEQQRWDATIAAVNRLHPDFFVVCGDLTHKTGDPEQIAAFQRIAGKLDKTIPLHLVAGNHDVANQPTAATLAAYRQTFGPDWYSFDHLSCHFVVIDSTLIKAPPPPPDNVPDELKAQWDWLRLDLQTAAAARPRKLHAFVFMHHPPFIKTADERDQYDNISLVRRQPLLDLFHQSGVEAIFAGHTHRSILTSDGAMKLIVTNALSRSNSGEPPGFRIVKVFADRLEYDYVALDKLPEKVTLEAGAVATR